MINANSTTDDILNTISLLDQMAKKLYKVTLNKY